MNLVFLLTVVSPRARVREPIAVIDGLALERQLLGRSRLIAYRERFNATSPGALSYLSPYVIASRLSLSLTLTLTPNRASSPRWRLLLIFSTRGSAA